MGPSIYDLTAELMAWVARQLATELANTAGVLGPVEAFGLDTVRDACAEIGLAAPTRRLGRRGLGPATPDQVDRRRKRAMASVHRRGSCSWHSQR
ncbi:MAG: hypothetical protein ACSLFA_02950 [Mycobacterium sp.]